MEEKDVYTAKTVEEAIGLGLKDLGATLDEVEITVLEEGKKRLFGSIKAKVKVVKKAVVVPDSERAVKFINGLLKTLGIEGESKVISDGGECIEIEIVTPSSAKVIGKRGDVLDAIQCMAGAVANIGREKYKKVVVDCENYRSQREETLKNLAEKLAAKALEKGRKMILEPMNPYERRIIHSALAGREDVKTASEGREPNRYVVVIPNNAKPYDRGLRYGERPDRREHGDRRDRRDNDRRDRRDGGRRDNKDRRSHSEAPRPQKRAKKEIYFGAFLGNSNKEAQKSEPENLSDDGNE